MIVKEILGVGINDCYGNNSKSRFLQKSYYTWYDMLRRCYGYHRKSHKHYKGCSVCEEWRTLSNFKKWFNDNYIEGYHLDKDILVQGNKVYSPETCCFVPKSINSFLAIRSKDGCELPIGIYKRRGKFNARCMDFNKKRIFIGSFDNTEEAFNAYCSCKYDIIKKVACEYFNDGKINEKIYNALLNYKIRKY